MIAEKVNLRKHGWIHRLHTSTTVAIGYPLKSLSLSFSELFCLLWKHTIPIRISSWIGKKNWRISMQHINSFVIFYHFATPIF
jgi:hypothetical protein